MRYLLYLTFIVISGLSIAQQEQHFTQYMVNPYTINPALGGTEDFIDIKMGFRQQWVGFDAAPRTYYLTGHTTLGKEFNAGGYHHKTEHKSWHGVGGYVYQDRTGPISRTSFSGQYAYNLPLNRSIRMSIGTFFGVKQFSYDLSGLKKEDVTDQVLPNTQIVQTMPDMSFGLWTYTKDWYVGASVFQLFQNKISLDELTSFSNADDNGKLVSHFFVTGGVKLPASELFTFIPSFAIKGAPNSPVSLDLNGKLDFNDQYFAGLSYRHGDAFAIVAGTVINKVLEVSYSYDLTTSDIRLASSGSHEIIVGLRLKHPAHIMCASRFW